MILKRLRKQSYMTSFTKWTYIRHFITIASSSYGNKKATNNNLIDFCSMDYNKLNPLVNIIISVPNIIANNYMSLFDD